ncbi:MAG TPA: glycosyltransferase [Anaerolineales bacterium]|nr:glycosyltransferase [Anaerolineales bacterium]
MKTRVLILFSDTGGGHRSAGEALREALATAHGAEATIEAVDVFKKYMPYPFSRFPAWYPAIIRRGSRSWGRGFKLTDGPRRSRAISGFFWPYVRRAVRRLVRDHPADVIVSVHPLMIYPVIQALGRNRPPFVTVVTDLASTHAWWYHPNTDLCIVPTEFARERAVRCGLAAHKVRVLGLPVAARFCVPAGDKELLRARLGWGRDQPVVMIVGGGEGMGPLAEIAQAVAASGLHCELVVVAGRNEALRARLVAAPWTVPTHIYGFVTEMPDFMRAADVLVSKAGPGTICEALNAGLPIILYGYLPGQEAGNVAYVVEAGAGLWAPGPQRVVEALRRWIGPEADPQALPQAAANARRQGRPTAARDIAAAIWETAQAGGTATAPDAKKIPY